MEKGHIIDNKKIAEKKYKNELTEIKVNENKIPTILKFTPKIYERLTKKLIEKSITISTMESCTGGMVVSLLTDTQGASAVVKGSSVTYCNEEKIRCKVRKETIEKYGVYSKQTADAMAKAVRKSQNTSIGIGITGTFSNADMNNADSIPGEVYFSISIGDEVYSFVIHGIPNMQRHDAKLLVAYYAAEKILSYL